MNAHENDIWLSQFDREDVQFVVLDLRDDDALVKTLRCQQEWSVDYEGDGAVVFARAA
jgi:hypothetical protein